MFKDLLNVKEPDETEFVADFENKINPQPGFRAVYKLVINEMKKPLIVDIDVANVECYYGDIDGVDVEIQVSSKALEDIFNGKSTFQRTFMSGDMKMKGDFKIFRTLDLLYPVGM